MSGAAGQAGEAGGEGAESGAGGAPGSDEGGMGEGEGGGYGTGSAGQRSPGAVSDLDTISTPYQLESGVPFSPDEFGNNEYLGQASDGAANAGSESVSPTYRRGEATHNNDTSTIPLGLRDLIKDYFSALDQR